MLHADPNVMAQAMFMIQNEFQKSNDPDNTQWLLLRKLSALSQTNQMDEVTFTILYWYTCGYRDGFGKGADLD